MSNAEQILKILKEKDVNIRNFNFCVSKKINPLKSYNSFVSEDRKLTKKEYELLRGAL